MGISPIQAINFFRTQPVNFAEAQRVEQSRQTNPFMSQAFSSGNSPYHLEHPSVENHEFLAKKLDLIG